MKGALLFSAALLISPSIAHARVGASDLQQLSFREHPGAQLPLDASVRDESGQATTLRAVLKGKPAVFVLEYLRCSNLCSLVLSGAMVAMRNAHLAPGKQLNLVALSIDPRDTARDASAARAMYASRFPDLAASDGMHFLTASPDQVRRIATVVGFPYRYDRATDQFAHPAGFVVATPSGRISRYMLGLNPNPGVLREAVREADSGTVEPPAHPFLLLCFGYDPDEGTAAALAMRLVRWASLGVIVACASLVLFLLSRRQSA